MVGGPAKQNHGQKCRRLSNELYLEVTGQKVIPTDQLTAKKDVVGQKSREHENVLQEILNNPDIRDQFILKLTYHSNSIEGSTLTEPDTAAILFDNVALPDKSLVEQLEAKNHQTALNYLFGHLSKGEKIDEDLILKLHGVLMNGLRPDAGSYRNHGVKITGVNLPTANHMSVRKLMGEVLTRATEKTKDIINLSAAVHAKFEQIHPFSDGNGRIGRLVMNAMLLHTNVAPAIVRQEKNNCTTLIFIKHKLKTTTVNQKIFFAMQFWKDLRFWNG